MADLWSYITCLLIHAEPGVRREVLRILLFSR